MRTFTISMLFALGAPLLLSACSNDIAVTESHLRMVSEKCGANDGLTQIVQADASALYENCGYRCSKLTGKHEYTATFSCKNGAKFDLKWQE